MFKNNLNRILSEKKKFQKISQAQIARLVGVTPSSITEWLKGRGTPNANKLTRLAEVLGVTVSDLIDDPDKKSKDFLGGQLIDLKNWKTLKVIGSIPAGVPIEAVEDFIGEIAVPPNLARPGNFALRVSGDSMEPRILDGDIVVIAPCPCPDSGDIVAIRVNGDNEVTLKKIVRSGEAIMLIPENSKYSPRILTPDSDIRVLGKVVSLNRKF